MYEKLTPGSIILLIAVYVVALVFAVAPIFALARHRKRCRTEGPETWLPIGTAPADFDLALSLIRIHAVHLFGNDVLSLRWGGFVEWMVAEASGVIDYDVPVIRVRWTERIEDSVLAVLLLGWIGHRLEMQKEPAVVDAAVLSIAVDIARLAGRSTR
jgi:hypothetical protein